MSLLDVVHFGSSLSVRNCVRFGSSMSLYGAISMGSSISVLDMISIGSSLSLRSYIRLGSSMSVFGITKLGSCLSVLDSTLFGSSISIRSFTKNVELAPENIPCVVPSPSSNWRHSPLPAQGSSTPNAADGHWISVRSCGNDDKISKKWTYLDLRKPQSPRRAKMELGHLHSKEMEFMLQSNRV